MPCIICHLSLIISFLQLQLLTGVQIIYIYIYVYILHIVYIYVYIFVTFVHSAHDFAWFALICFIEIWNKKQVELLQINITDNISQSFQEISIQQNI